MSSTLPEIISNDKPVANTPKPPKAHFPDIDESRDESQSSSSSYDQIEDVMA